MQFYTLSLVKKTIVAYTWRFKPSVWSNEQYQDHRTTGLIPYFLEGENVKSLDGILAMSKIMGINQSVWNHHSQILMQFTWQAKKRRCENQSKKNMIQSSERVYQGNVLGSSSAYAEIMDFILAKSHHGYLLK